MSVKYLQHLCTQINWQNVRDCHLNPSYHSFHVAVYVLFWSVFLSLNNFQVLISFALMVCYLIKPPACCLICPLGLFCCCILFSIDTNGLGDWRWQGDGIIGIGKLREIENQGNKVMGSLGYREIEGNQEWRQQGNGIIEGIGKLRDNRMCCMPQYDSTCLKKCLKNQVALKMVKGNQGLQSAL